MRKFLYNLSIRNKILIGFFSVFIIFAGVGFNQYNSLVKISNEKETILLANDINNNLFDIQYLIAEDMLLQTNLIAISDNNQLKLIKKDHQAIKLKIESAFNNIDIKITTGTKNKVIRNFLTKSFYDSVFVNKNMYIKDVDAKFAEIYKTQELLINPTELKNQLLQRKIDLGVNDTSATDSSGVDFFNNLNNIVSNYAGEAKTEQRKQLAFAQFTANQIQKNINFITIRTKNYIKAADVSTTRVRNNALNVSILILVSGVIASMLISLLISNVIVFPLTKLQRFTLKLAKGELPQYSGELYNDEIGKMGMSINQLIVGLRQTSDFAYEIGKGNFSTDYHPLSEKDVLGNSLLDMRKSLQLAKEEEQKRVSEDILRNWTTDGLAKFADILRYHTENIRELASDIITNLVKYLNANQGGLFIYNDNDPDDIHLELLAAYAYNRKKFLKKKVKMGEGLVGAIAVEKYTLHLTNLPNEYIEIESGIGSTNPNNLVIVPLKIDEEILGVIEIASFKLFSKTEIDLVEKIADSIASTLSTARINTRTAELLEQSKQHTRAMKEQEEEMRQTIEEMQASQEESIRREEKVYLDFKELHSLSKTIEQQNSVLSIENEEFRKDMQFAKVELENYIAFQRNLLETTTDIVFITDSLGNITFANSKSVQILGFKPAEIIGRNINKLMNVENKLDDLETALNVFTSKIIKASGVDLEVRNKNNVPETFFVNVTRLISDNKSQFLFFMKDTTEILKARRKTVSIEEQMLINEFEYNVRIEALEARLTQHEIEVPSTDNDYELLSFDSGFKIDLNIIDLQHKKWIDLINNLYNMVKRKESKSKIEIILADLFDYTEYHFGFEEKYLKDFKFPDFNKHKEQHDLFSSKVMEQLNMYKSGQEIASVKLLAYIKKWVKEHINTFDKAYVPTFKNNGLY